MPIFEYKCRQCGHVTGFLEKAGAKGPHKCEKCGSGKTDKAFSTFAAQVGSASQPAGCAHAGSCASGSCPHKHG
jgi:putative FmdB family regulatory protein